MNIRLTLLSIGIVLLGSGGLAHAVEPPEGSYDLSHLALAEWEKYDWLTPKNVTTTGDGFQVRLTARQFRYDNDIPNPSQFSWDFWGDVLGTWGFQVDQGAKIDTTFSDENFAHFLRLHYDYLLLVKNVGNTPMTSSVTYTFTAEVPSSNPVRVTRSVSKSGSSEHASVVGHVPQHHDIGSVKASVTGTATDSGSQTGSIYSQSGTESFTLNPGEEDYITLEILWIKFCEKLKSDLFSSGLTVEYDAGIKVTISAS